MQPSAIPSAHVGVGSDWERRRCCSAHQGHATAAAAAAAAARKTTAAATRRQRRHLHHYCLCMAVLYNELGRYSCCCGTADCLPGQLSKCCCKDCCYDTYAPNHSQFLRKIHICSQILPPPPPLLPPLPSSWYSLHGCSTCIEAWAQD